jgi:hypothetical protein
MDNVLRDRIFLIGAISLVVIFLLDFFRINITNNVTVVIVIGTGIVVIIYIHRMKNSDN